MTKPYESWDEGKRLKITTINLYPRQIKLIDKIIEAGYTANRSLFIRTLLDQYSSDYFKMMKAFELLTVEQIKVMGE